MSADIWGSAHISARLFLSTNSKGLGLSWLIRLCQMCDWFLSIYRGISYDWVLDLSVIDVCCRPSKSLMFQIPDWYFAGMINNILWSRSTRMIHFGADIWNIYCMLNTWAFSDRAIMSDLINIGKSRQNTPQICFWIDAKWYILNTR